VGEAVPQPERVSPSISAGKILLGLIWILPTVTASSIEPEKGLRVAHESPNFGPSKGTRLRTQEGLVAMSVFQPENELHSAAIVLPFPVPDKRQRNAW